MDGNIFDRITRTLADSGPRRAAIRTVVGTGVATLLTRLGADGVGAKKKRCRKIGQSCGGKKKCCRNDKGAVSCVEFIGGVGGECKGEGLPAGFRCCGQIGAPCDPKFGDREGNGVGNCSCCPPLSCGTKTKNGKVIHRCTDEDT